MADEKQTGESGRGVLARVTVGPRAHVRVGARVLTMELALKFSNTLLSDLTHSVETASLAVGLRPSTVTDAISRYRNDKCQTLDDEEVCEVVFQSKAEHVRELRKLGHFGAVGGNRAATTWAQWQLEHSDPTNYPRKAVEVKGEASAQTNADGSSETRIRYVVTVPQEEPEE